MDRPAQTVAVFPHAFACECGSPQLVPWGDRGKTVSCRACGRTHGPFDLASTRARARATRQPAPARAGEQAAPTAPGPTRSGRKRNLTGGLILLGCALLILGGVKSPLEHSIAERSKLVQ